MLHLNTLRFAAAHPVQFGEEKFKKGISSNIFDDYFNPNNAENHRDLYIDSGITRQDKEVGATGKGKKKAAEEKEPEVKKKA